MIITDDKNSKPTFKELMTMKFDVVLDVVAAAIHPYEKGFYFRVLFSKHNNPYTAAAE